MITHLSPPLNLNFGYYRDPLRKLVVTANAYASKATVMVTSGMESLEIIDTHPDRTSVNKN
jgi:hypothetical protein